jgi:hypothetical protein
MYSSELSMKHMFENLSIAAKIAAIGGILVLYWLVSDDSTKAYLKHIPDSYGSTDISSVSITIGDKDILFNISINKPMTCKDILEIFPTSVPLRDKTYLPTCTTVEPTYVILTYKEQLTT